ncbi:MAG: exo-alpha-sialidase [Clostridia bacterium]|nr:exo-alpha-sialidase [Clostridia bacterium]
MEIRIQRIGTEFNGERCYVHARGLIRPEGFGIITTQKLELSGCDVFYGLEVMKTIDGGESFSAPSLSQNLTRRYFENGNSVVMSDATPFYHEKSGKIILTGHTVMYGANNKLLRAPRPVTVAYAVYDEASGEFGAYKEIIMPDKEKYFSCSAGCAQIMELPTGELLIPVYYDSYAGAAKPNSCTCVAVLRCSFDGESIGVIEIGNELKIDLPRGLGEPSIAKFGEEYFLALRNDRSGYVAKSADGLHFDQPREICFDNGGNIGNYNTQQHWITGGGRLWMVYTRRAGNNDHIFRHRAPLFIAEFDPERMCLIRDTEQIAVPERGARLGNFGCQSYSEDVGYIFASEWMQNDPHGWEKCAERGSDNTIFVSKIIF